MISRPRLTARAGLSMLEVVISSAVLSLLVLAMMAATAPLSRTTSEQGIAFDMDRAAGRFLDQLRREVRQSGYDSTAAKTPQINLTNATTLNYRARVAFGETAAAWFPVSPAFITYTAVGDGTFKGGTARFRVTRTNIIDPVLVNVKSLAFVLATGSATLEVTLELARDNPNWTGSTAPPLIVRKYQDQIEFLNTKD